MTEECIWFVDQWGRNYFHWLTDSLPRLINIQDLLKGKIVLLPYNYRECDYIDRSLSYFKDIKIRYIEKNEVIHCNKLLIPTQACLGGGNYYDEDIRKIRNLINSVHQDYDITKSSDKIYISRKKAKYRKILNEENVASLLKEYGFDILCFEDYSWGE